MAIGYRHIDILKLVLDIGGSMTAPIAAFGWKFSALAGRAACPQVSNARSWPSPSIYEISVSFSVQYNKEDPHVSVVVVTDANNDDVLSIYLCLNVSLLSGQGGGRNFRTVARIQPRRAEHRTGARNLVIWRS